MKKILINLSITIATAIIVYTIAVRAYGVPSEVKDEEIC